MKFTFFFLLFTQVSFAQMNLGELKGTVISQDGESVPFAKAILYKGDSLREEFVGGAMTDFDGDFMIKAIPAGTYNLEITDDVGLAIPKYIKGIVIKTDEITSFEKIEVKYDETIECGYDGPIIPIVPKKEIGNGVIIEKEDIRRP
ncbi:MAG: carboxypeptidase-like regulatory domain-containing protein [Crocinitomicaceae bacterium]